MTIERPTPPPQPGTCPHHGELSLRIRGLEHRVKETEDDVDQARNQLVELKIEFRSWTAKIMGGIGVGLAILQVVLKFLPSLLFVVAIAGCAAPWNAARGTISGARGALDAIAEFEELPQDQLSQPLDIIRSSLDAGDLAVDIWEEEGADDPPSGWRKWAARIPDAANAVISIIKSCGVAIPPAINMGLLALHALLAIIGAT